MDRWKVTESVSAVELFIWMWSITDRLSTDFAMSKALSQVKNHPVGCPQFIHLRIMSKCWHPSNTVEAICTLAHSNIKRVSQQSTAHSAQWSEPSPTQNAKRAFLESSGLRDFCQQFQEILTEDPNLPNNLLMTDAAHLICMVQFISRTNYTGQLQILKNFTNAPLRPKSHCLVCCLVQTSSCILLL
jgi:hypothetical protein